MEVVALAQFGNSLFAVLVAVCCIDFLVAVCCIGLDTALELVQSPATFSGEQASASP